MFSRKLVQELADTLRLAKFIIRTQSGSLKAKDILANPSVFEVWEAGQAYTKGQVVRYNDVCYRVKNNITSTATQTPDRNSTNYQAIKDENDQGQGGNQQ